MERIGIFGGSFDPLHYGHLTLAKDAYEELRLDRVLFVVAKLPWQKETVASVDARWLMVNAALSTIPWAEVSDVEIMREGPTYTIDTVRDLQAQSPRLSKYFLILGEDQGRNLHTWKGADLIHQCCDVHIFDRWLNLSSTAIRERVANGQTIEYLVPQPVAAIIANYSLYLN